MLRQLTVRLRRYLASSKLRRAIALLRIRRRHSKRTTDSPQHDEDDNILSS